VTESEVVLGSHTALSGPVSAWGVGSTEGTRMRFDEANEKGVHGRKIKFVVEDNQYQVPRAVQAANKLINNDKIFAMLGALGTPMNNAGAGRAAGQGRSQPVPVHGRALDGGALPQAEVRVVLHLLRPGSLLDKVPGGEGGQEEDLLDVPGHRLRPRDP
jgi:Periplasmic binding protein